MKKEVKVKITETIGEGPQHPHDVVYYGRKPVGFSGIVEGDPQGLIPPDCTLSWEEPDLKHKCDKMPNELVTRYCAKARIWDVCFDENYDYEVHTSNVYYCSWCGNRL